MQGSGTRCPLTSKIMVETGVLATPRNSAIAIIKEEHRSLGYLMYTLQRVLHDVTMHKAEADFNLRPFRIVS